MVKYSNSFLKKILKGGNINTFSKEKILFILLVFINLILQLGITYYFMNYFKYENIKNEYLILLSIFIFLMIFIIFMVPIWLKFIIFIFISISIGIILSRLINNVNKNLINIAIISTIIIFILMFTIGLLLILMKINLSYSLGLILFYSLFILIIIEILNIFMNTYSLFYKIISFISLLLFSLYVIYDTNIILQRNYNGDFIRASLDYYFDIINLFSSELSLNN